MNNTTEADERQSFSDLLALIKLGFMPVPATVLEVDMLNDMVVRDHGDADVNHDRSYGHASIYDYGSAGALADAIEARMENYGMSRAIVWFEGMTVHYAGLPALDRATVGAHE